MEQFYEHRLPVDSRDVDGRGQCKASALLGHLQEAATRAAEAGGFGREPLLRGYHAFWMLTRIWFCLRRPLGWGEELTITTWHRGGRSAVMYRDFDLQVGEELVGEAVSAWVLADLDSRKLLRLGGVPELEGTDGGARCKDRTLNKLRLPAQFTPAERRLMRYSDTDINGHVNNTRYADFACDAVRMDRMERGVFLQAMQIGYLAECMPGEELTMLTGRQGDAVFVRGMDAGGKSRYDAAMNFGQVIP